MPTPQPTDERDAMIASMAEQALGPAPDPAAAAGGRPPAGLDPKAEAKQGATPTEQASEKGSPDTEGDRMSADAILYEIEFDKDDKRKLTPAQIRDTFERYARLNHVHGQLTPVLQVVGQMLKSNPEASPQDLAVRLTELANQHNPEMGRTRDTRPDRASDGRAPEGRTGADDNEDISAKLTAWEQENAATLPPGYKELLTGNGQQFARMQEQLAQTQRMLQAVLAQSQGMTDAARQGMDQARQGQTSAIRQQIANNIDRIQAHLKLPDEAANDFLVFAAERGFTLEDFVDPNLAFRVMSDFANNRNSPEMDRLRQIAERRQAYTGGLGGSPAGGAPAPVAGAGGEDIDPMLDRLASRALER